MFNRSILEKYADEKTNFRKGKSYIKQRIFKILMKRKIIKAVVELLEDEYLSTIALLILLNIIVTIHIAMK